MLLKKVCFVPHPTNIVVSCPFWNYLDSKGLKWYIFMINMWFNLKLPNFMLVFELVLPIWYACSNVNDFLHFWGIAFLL